MADKTALAHQAAELATQTHAVELAENIVYLMGLSFIVGSLFTIFILIVLDFIKQRRGAN